jgi:hypothetical protein
MDIPPYPSSEQPNSSNPPSSNTHVHAKAVHKKSIVLTAAIVISAVALGAVSFMTQNSPIRTALRTQVNNEQETSSPQPAANCPAPLIAGDVFSKTLLCDPDTSSTTASLVDPLDLYGSSEEAYNQTVELNAWYVRIRPKVGLGEYEIANDISAANGSDWQLPPISEAGSAYMEVIVSCLYQCVCHTGTNNSDVCSDHAPTEAADVITVNKQECTPITYKGLAAEEYPSYEVEIPLTWFYPDPFSENSELNDEDAADHREDIMNAFNNIAKNQNKNWAACQAATVNLCGEEASLSFCEDVDLSGLKPQINLTCQTCSQSSPSSSPASTNPTPTGTPNATSPPDIPITCGPPGATLNEEEQANSNAICQGNNGGESYCDTNGVCTTADGSPVPPPPGWLDNISPTTANFTPTP